MVTVAIAGGTSGIGLNIVREVHATEKHEVVVLSRSPRPDLETKGLSVRVVDYGSPEQLKKALLGVHTVISCIWSYGPELVDSQLALLAAAKEEGVKRFVPSDWAIDRYEALTFYQPKIAVWEAVQRSGLEYTRFVNGIWMNIWGCGAPRNEDEAVAGYSGPPFLIDLQQRKAIIPGDGSQKVAFTDMGDIGKLVAASLELQHWDPTYTIVGDKLSYNEVVRLSEKITGHTFEKAYVPQPQIESVLSGNPDAKTRVMNEYMRLINEGAFDFEGTLNAKFPNLKTIKAEDYLSRYWAEA